ncbi:MAG: cysteine desulfurase [Burkholderiales bacterium]|nr:cysteine desulfurase [Burkholderiales bacterium]
MAYLDHTATTPLEGEVLEAMLPFLTDAHGNPSSAHSFGRRAKEAMEAARAEVAEAAGAMAARVIFTGGGSEANNLFLKGFAAISKPGRVAVSAIEHPSVSKAAASLPGWALRRIAVDSRGKLDLADLDCVFSEPVSMISVMLANNETGIIQDIAKIAARAKAAGVRMHTDAVQAFGKIPVDFAALGVQAMTLSAHKLGGPKGVGALILDKRLSISPLIDGGGQEFGLRSGTENVAGIVGFGAAARLAAVRMRAEQAALLKLRHRIEEALRASGAVLFSGGPDCLPNTVYFSFPGIDGGTLVVELDRKGHAVASGSACASGATEPSEVLLAMGVQPDIARGAVRVSLGKGCDPESVENFLIALRSVTSGLLAILQD